MNKNSAPVTPVVELPTYLDLMNPRLETFAQWRHRDDVRFDLHRDDPFYDEVESLGYPRSFVAEQWQAFSEYHYGRDTTSSHWRRAFRKAVRAMIADGIYRVETVSTPYRSLYIAEALGQIIGGLSKSKPNQPC